MASIFTYNEEPVRVASPWLQGNDSGSDTPNELRIDGKSSSPLTAPPGTPDSQSGRRVLRLQAEPQVGPVEYKLHLLLRARRKFRSSSDGGHISGSKHAKFGPSSAARSVSESVIDSGTSSGNSTPSAASAASALQTRQHRLEQLTTQLLWRLQQSCPHHTSSATNIILPSLPEALPELLPPQHPGKLLHGLEESQGALYEIGVSDDGTLVGLAEDELHESLNNLRAMAACMGCTVEVLRKEIVGECEWIEETIIGSKERKIRRSGKLVVAEALVKPFLQPASPGLAGKDMTTTGGGQCVLPSAAEAVTPTTDQLRVTLTGPTMSGKSTLLGTLTTSTLDNGRGKSRLSMLKHRHEITSGVTSSVTQELLGYQEVTGGDVQVVNYATENVASWIDIHATSAASRLVFISDSAGHPRYRRTTVRGLVGWAPHWTLLCIPADDSEDGEGKPGGTHASQQPPVPSEMDLAGAQLDLCLRLGLPLVVVITKLDLASRTGLRSSLTKVLDALKAAGRKPVMFSNKMGAVAEAELQLVPATLLDSACNTAVPLLNDPRGTVPIILTSAVDGTGIGNLHALLHELPIPDASPADSPETSLMVFDIEDVYSKPAEVEGVIISGHLRRGHFSVGDTAVIGPFSGHDQQEDSEDSDERPFRRSSSHLPTSRSFPGALKDSHFAPPLYQLPNQEWRRVKVTSIRNLRLPVHSLHADQVGTVVVTLEGQTETKIFPLSRVRKGMVLAAIQPLATRTFTASFKREDLELLAVGNHVVVYMSSVRASAKVISARAPDSPQAVNEDRRHSMENDSHDPFSFDDLADALDGQPNAQVAGAVTAPDLLVTFTFDAPKEFVMLGDQVLVMPGGGAGVFGGLEGFVGLITDVRG